MFTLSWYRKLIVELRDEFSFVIPSEFDPCKQGQILLMHDVDFSIDAAVYMSTIETREEIKATYFIQVSSSFYNIFEASNVEMLRSIAKHHEIGLHFYPSTPEVGWQNIYAEMKALGDITDFPVRAVNYHLVGELLKSKQAKTIKCRELLGVTENYKTLIDIVFDPDFRKLAYFSDSRGEWKHGHPHYIGSVLEEGKNVKIVTHPFWWGEYKSSFANLNVRMSRKIKNLFVEEQKQIFGGD